MQRSFTQKRILGLLVFLFLPTQLLAQQDEHHHHDQAREKIGKVYFQTSCSPAVQRDFDRAVAWLHSFEYGESERLFAEIASRDSRCAMAYWGIAMSQYHQLWAPPTPDELAKASQAIQKAKQMGATTARERDYINAIDTFVEGWEKVSHRERAVRYEQAMERLYLKYSRDREAGIFYALALNASALASVPMDKTYAKQKKGALILNRALVAEPDHPGITHYLIHSYDYPPIAYLALPAARRYAKIAPSSAHALHMPSHIFTRLGLWDEDIATNIRSEDSAKNYATRMKLAGTWDEQLHAMDYLAYAYLQTGRDREAAAVLTELRAIRKTDPENFKVAYSFAAIPARWALERHEWREASELKIEHADFPWSRFKWAEAITHFAKGVGAAKLNNVAAASAEVDTLKDIHKQLIGAKENYDWASQIEIQIKAVEGWQAKAEGRNEDAVRLMRAAADLEDSTEKHPVTPGAVLPAREMLGDLLLELNKPVDALKEYQQSLTTSPNRFNGLAGAARAAELAGDRMKAAMFYSTLLKISASSDGQRPEIQRAKDFVARSGNRKNVRSVRK
jgi:tetratricopeptide (TPR) repeat protein